MTDDPKHLPPDVEERYNNATNTSNLKVDPERRLPADMLIAMGWSPSRLGAALMRLHSEWDGSEKPRRPTKERIDLIACSLPRIKNGERKDKDGQMIDNMVLDIKAARHQAHDWYMHELKILFQKLKTMPAVRQQLLLWAQQRQINDPDNHVGEVLSWWLDHTCPVCECRGKELIPGTPVKSHRDCKECRGTGETRIPWRQNDPQYQMESRTMLRHIDDCIATARSALKHRLNRINKQKTTSTT